MVVGISDIYHSFECAYVYDERCYFVDFEGNSICSFDMNDGEIKVVL